MRKVLWRRGVPCVRRRDERKKEKKACIRRVDKIAARLLFPFFSFSFLPFLSSLSSSSSQDRAGRERKLIHAAVKLPRGNYAYYAPRVRSLCELPAFNKKANDDKEIRGETPPLSSSFDNASSSSARYRFSLPRFAFRVAPLLLPAVQQ